MLDRIAWVVVLAVLCSPAGFGQNSLAPELTKSFGALSIPLGSTTTLTFTLSNPNTNVTLTGLAFSDVLPTGLIISTPNGQTGSCDGGTIAATAGTGSILLSSASLGPGATCTFSVSVTATAAGLQSNVSSTVTSLEAVPGAAATASINVGGGDYQVRYAANLNVAASVINITNTGESSTGESGGNICVNVYALADGGQFVACCSCLVTPDGLNSLSAPKDFIFLTNSVTLPTALVIKLVSTSLVGKVCNPASLTADPAILAGGLRAWATTTHALPTAPGGLAVTETEFSQAVLSASELTHLATTCGFLQANGSGFGICASCRTGGLGGQKTN